MSLRILHTADWHLGHSLHDQPRVYEHAQFFDWLLATLESERVDVLLVAGDVFDSANPSAMAQAMLYEFLARAASRVPSLQIVQIGGNHDSPARLEAPDPILRSLRIRSVGRLPRDGGSIDLERVLIPLRDAGGEVAAWLAAVPYLRSADLERVDGDQDPLIEGVRLVYRQVLEAARARRDDGQALLATGHCYMSGTGLSDLSERRILGGNLHALPATIFPDDVAYVALGHLHLAQTVGDRENVRYAGSPIPLSMAETTYLHQVCVITIEGAECAEIRPLPVPRSVPIMRIPRDRSRPLDDVLAQLAELDLDEQVVDPARPYLEVRVLLDKPEPDLRSQIDTALDDKPVRLVKIATSYTGHGHALADDVTDESLADIDEVEVFRRQYQKTHDGEPSAELLEAFCELAEEAKAEE